MALVTLCDPQVNEQGRELTRHGSALFPIACYHDALSLGAVPWHWHPELEVFTVSGGTAIAAAGAERFAVCQHPSAPCGVAAGGLGLPSALGGVPSTAGGRKSGQCLLVQVPATPLKRGRAAMRPSGRRGGLARRRSLRRGTGLDRVRAGIPRLRVSGPRGIVTVDLSTVPAPCPRLLVQTGQLAARRGPRQTHVGIHPSTL